MVPAAAEIFPALPAHSGSSDGSVICSSCSLNVYGSPSVPCIHCQSDVSVSVFSALATEPPVGQKQHIASVRPPARAARPGTCKYFFRFIQYLLLFIQSFSDCLFIIAEGRYRKGNFFPSALRGVCSFSSGMQCGAESGSAYLLQERWRSSCRSCCWMNRPVARKTSGRYTE